MGKNILSVVPGRGHGENDDHNNDNRASRPIHTDFIDFVQILDTKDIDQVTNERHAPEAQGCLPCTCRKIFIPKRDGAENQLGPAKIDRQRDSPISH